jgi:hypothetical protein
MLDAVVDAEKGARPLPYLLEPNLSYRLALIIDDPIFFLVRLVQS